MRSFNYLCGISAISAVILVFAGCSSPLVQDMPSGAPLAEADACFLKSDYNKALALYLSYVEQNPANGYFRTEASLRAGQCLIILNQYTSAINQLRNTLDMNPSGPSAAMAHKLLADAYRVSDDYTSAARHYKSAMSADKRGLIPEQVLYYTGLSLLRTGEWDSGYDTLRGVVRDYPNTDFARTAQDKVNYKCNYFSIQLGAFRSRENAEKRLNELKSKGISDCRIEEQIFKEDTYFCIRQGNFAEYAGARQKMESLRNANIDAIVMP